MRRKIAIYCTLMIAVFISGCSVTETLSDKQEEFILKQSGIVEDTEYKEYLQLMEEGKLDANGEYHDTEVEEYISETDDERTKSICVTFAKNEFLKVHYYSDANLTQEIEGDSVYLDPGEKIYCSQPSTENEYSSSYVFSEFQIYEFDENDSKGKLFGTAGEQSLILDIPEDYEGTQLAIFPIGKYEKRGLNLEAYYINSNGSKQTVNGTWYVNNEVYNPDTDQVSATDDYTVQFKYDYDTYYYKTAAPEPFSTTLEETKNLGVVSFKTSSALSNEEAYSIELHRWIKAKFDGEIGKIHSINEVEDLDNDENWNKGDQEYTKLKGGDTLTVITENDYRLFSHDLAIGDPEPYGDDGYKYIITIPNDEYSTEYSISVVKTELSVSLDSSLGSDIGIKVIASDIENPDHVYNYDTQQAGKLKHTYEIISEKSIGLEDNVSIWLDDYQAKNGQAIKLDITKTDGDKNKTSEIKYISESNGSAEIALYAGEIKNTKKIYEQVNIIISLVDILEVNIPEIDNGTIKLVLNDGTQSEEIENGSVVEGSRKATVTIEPDAGYYVSGKDTSDYKYAKKMKLSDYNDDIADIIKNHEVKKLYNITLETEDPYGTVTFKLNGDIVTGTITAREEDNLTLVYELTDSDYKIVRKSGNILGKINDFRKNTFSSNKETVKISLSDKDFDGKTLKREDYITVSHN